MDSVCIGYSPLVASDGLRLWGLFVETGKDRPMKKHLNIRVRMMIFSIKDSSMFAISLVHSCVFIFFFQVMFLIVILIQ